MVIGEFVKIFRASCILCVLYCPVVFARSDYTDVEVNQSLNRRLFHNLSPRDMGELHNQIMIQVHDRIANTRHLNHDQYSQIVYDELITTCYEGDSDCHMQVQENIKRGKLESKEFLMNSGSFDIHSFMPNEIDGFLKESFDDIIKAVRRLDKEPINDVLELLQNISDRTDKSDTHQLNKEMVQIVSSIAASSSSYWSYVQNDPENEFHKLHVDKNRKLQTFTSTVITDALGINIFTNIIGFILSDVLGAIKGLVFPIIFFVIGVGKPSVAVENSVRLSISDSLMAVGVRIPTPSDIILCALNLNVTSCDLYNFIS